ncbi:hypothetical protein JI59_25955 (plasmid) [Novosphingobium pentaromativorans US6-1]|uniref:Putative transposase for insertion sequence NGRIS-22a n=1 Tax=Novosphingobium pentaromativorans US6-1 TaxID=1088721 RepID=G6EKE4_9SPHN|nr:hypothetical protein JI59_25955 [Novosphingobium pentaromativorans US6-1]EHJ58247.1 putative transposase for insertion sequence NGRIS-22a [Novosphingobium pentaromativorans US6-1]
MRQKRIFQSSLFDLFADHQIGRVLKAISGWLDVQTELLPLLAADLVGLASRTRRARGYRENRFCGALCSSNIAS